MLKREDNELITRVGPGTPMGATLRRYWMPALLSSEVSHPDSDPVRVRILGEDLIAVRDTNGSVGLIQSNYPRLDILNTAYGHMYSSIRHLPEDKRTFLRVYHYVMPFYQLRAGGSPRTLGDTDGHVWVPSDDTSCWTYNFHFSHDKPQAY